MKRSPATTIPALSALAAGIAYAATLRNGYVYDDVAIVATQPLMHSLRYVPQLLVSPWWLYNQRLYRPLSQVSLCLDWVISGGAPWFAHAENMVLHALAAFLVARLALRWLSAEGALAAGLVFALTPAHVEAVSTVVGRAELLSAIFLLLALSLATSDDEPTAGRRIGMAALSALALASKEVGVVAPAVVLAGAWMHGARRRQAWKWTAAAVLGVVPLLAARFIVLGTLTGDLAHPAFRITGVAGREAIAFATLPKTMAHLLLPLTAPVDVAPTLAQVSSPDFRLIAAGAALAVIGIVLLVRHFARPSPFTLGTWITAAGMSPTSNLLFASGVVLAGRDLYAPSIGAALCLGAAVSAACAAARDRRVRVAVAAAGGAWLVIATGVSAMNLGMWRDRDRLVDALVRLEPDSYRSHMFAAEVAGMRGHPDVALRHYRVGVALFAGDPMFDTDAARAALSAGDTASALRWLRDAVWASPEHSFLARTRLVFLLMARGDSASALRLVNAGLAVLPDQRVWRDLQTRLTAPPRS